MNRHRLSSVVTTFRSKTRDSCTSAAVAAPPHSFVRSVTTCPAHDRIIMKRTSRELLEGHRTADVKCHGGGVHGRNEPLFKGWDVRPERPHNRNDAGDAQGRSSCIWR